MLYFLIYAPIFAIMLVLACSDFDYRFTCNEPSNRRHNGVEGLEDQEELQRKPIRPNSGDPKQNLRTKKHTKMQHSRSVGTGPARGHHGPLCVTHGRASWVARSCAPFLLPMYFFPTRPFDFDGFCCFCSLK